MHIDQAVVHLLQQQQIEVVMDVYYYTHELEVVVVPTVSVDNVYVVDEDS